MSLLKITDEKLPRSQRSSLEKAERIQYTLWKKGGSFSSAIFNSDIQQILVALLKVNIHTLFCLVDIKKRPVLSSCVFDLFSWTLAVISVFDVLWEGGFFLPGNHLQYPSYLTLSVPALHF